MSPDEQAIRDLNAAWIAAVNTGDLDRLLGWLTEDLLLLGPGRPPAGRSEFAASYAEALRQSRFVCTSEVQEVSVSGDVAYTVCRDELSMTPNSGGDTLRFAGHRITIWRRQPDGRWLLARDAHTLAPVGDVDDGRSTPLTPAPSVVLFVVDVSRVSEFYREVAAMVVQHSDNDHTVLASHGLELVVHRLYGEPEAPTDAAGHLVVREDSYFKFCLPVASIASARQAASRLGGAIKPPDSEWSARGFRACDGHDPEGNVFQVRERDPQA